MRVALVSPYSWTYPGGVTRHIEALARRAGRARATTSACSRRSIRDGRRTALLHRGARPQARDVPEWLVPLGGTIGWPSNGAVSNLARDAVGGLDAAPRAARRAASTSCTCTSRSRRSIGWDALTSADAPLVGTFHCYSESRRRRTRSPR